MHGKKIQLEHLKKLAISKGGDYLSGNVKNIFTKVTWKCSLGHIWDAVPSNVMHHGRWCPTCAKNKKLSMEDVHLIASQRGGYCLSDSYLKSSHKMKWKCHSGHEFEKSVNDIKSRGSWCPYCKNFRAEEVCRKYFEKLFGCKFPRVRPNWLRNKFGFKLELDGLSEKTFDGKYIAFEHQGMQHFFEDYFPFKVDFYKILEHDHIKREKCTENNVILIVVNHLFRMSTIEQLIDSIKFEVIRYNLQVNIDFDQNIDLSNL